MVKLYQVDLWVVWVEQLTYSSWERQANWVITGMYYTLYEYTTRVWVYCCVSDLLKVVADPERDGCAPVPVPWNGPVASVSQPVPKTLLTYELWNPEKNRDNVVSGCHQSIWNAEPVAVVRFCMYIFTKQEFLNHHKILIKKIITAWKGTNFTFNFFS